MKPLDKQNPQGGYNKPTQPNQPKEQGGFGANKGGFGKTDKTKQGWGTDTDQGGKGGQGGQQGQR